MNKVFLHAKFHAYTLLCCQDTVKYDFAGPTGFRGFRETGPWAAQ